MSDQTSTYSKRLQKLVMLLKKNQDYLSMLSPDKTSTRIKVTSNIVVATIRLETLENNIAAMRANMAQKGCSTRCYVDPQIR